MTKYSTKLIALLLSIISISLTYTACRKTEYLKGKVNEIDNPTTRKFFNNHASNDPTISAINHKLYQLNQKTGFINKFVNYAGFPIWDKSKIFTKNSNARLQNLDSADEVVYIPFSPESYETIGSILLIGITGTDTTYEMLYNWDYAKYGYTAHSDSSWTAMDYFNIFADFEYEVFGNDEFMVKDKKIFGLNENDSLRYTVSRTTQVEKMSDVIETEYCTDYTICKVRPYSSSISIERMSVVPADCSEFTICTTYYYNYDNPDEPIGGGPASGGGGGGNPGPNPIDYGWYEDPCESGIQGDIADPSSTICGGTAGWMPLKPFIKVENYDVSGISGDNSSEALCFMNFLINYFPPEKAKAALTQMFLNPEFSTGNGSPKQFIFTFTLNSSLTGLNGQTVPAHSDLSEISPGVFRANISLNPTFWSNTSNEFVSATIIHELCHVYLAAFHPEILYENHHKEMWDHRYAGLIYLALRDFHPEYTNYQNAGLMGLALYGISDQFTDSNNQIDYTKNSECLYLFGINISDIITFGNQYLNNDLGQSFCQ